MDIHTMHSLAHTLTACAIHHKRKDTRDAKTSYCAMYTPVCDVRRGCGCAIIFRARFSRGRFARREDASRSDDDDDDDARDRTHGWMDGWMDGARGVGCASVVVVGRDWSRVRPSAARRPAPGPRSVVVRAVVVVVLARSVGWCERARKMRKMRRRQRRRRQRRRRR